MARMILKALIPEKFKDQDVHIGPNRKRGRKRGRNRGGFAFIDQMVYKLYGLTDEEIAIIDENVVK